MNTQGLEIISICNDLDIVKARSIARTIAREVGFSSVDQARIATAVSELSRNVFLYAGRGSVSARSIERGKSSGIEIVVEDQGLGIAHLETILQEKPYNGQGPGNGLQGARRLMDDFEIESQVGVGTRIVCRKWRLS